MALTPRSGFSNTTSGPNDVENDIPNTQADALNNMAYVEDAMLNKYALDTKAYPNVTKQLTGFIKGKRVLVTYYRQLRKGGANIRTNIADFPTTRNIINSEYQKILNLEITLPSGFTFESNPDRSSADVRGSAMMYPYLNPNVGDIFMCGVGDGRIGVFQISKVDISSWRNDRIYIVNFVLQSFADHSDVDPVEGAVTLVSVFSKANYLGGTASLLSEETYLLLQKAKSIRLQMLKYYHQTFHCSDINSYLRPDGVYDPFAIMFLANKMTMDDLHLRPKILTGQDSKQYKKTIWSLLEDRYNTGLQSVYPQYSKERFVRGRMAISATELIGYNVVVPQKGVDTFDYYVLSEDFYTGNKADMSLFELRLYDSITLRNCGDLRSLFTEYLDLVYSLSLDEQYYKIPIYIHWIDMALQSQYREIDAPSMSYGSTGE